MPEVPEIPEDKVLSEAELKERQKRFVSEPDEITFLTPEEVELLIQTQNKAN